MILNAQDNFDALDEYLRYGTKIPEDRWGLLKDDFYDYFDMDSKSQIIYTPKNLIIVPPGQAEQVLQPLYDNLAISAGKGIVPFYKLISNIYGNITRDEVTAFLQKQPHYQVRTRPMKFTKRPILAKPGEQYEVDLIDMGRYKEHTVKTMYILTVVDVGSRYIFLRALKTKDSVLVAAQLNQVFKTKNPKWSSRTTALSS